MVPTTTSGSYIVKTVPMQIPGPGANPSVVDLKASPDFVGYQVSLYSVKARREGGVRVVFESKKIHRLPRTNLPRRTIEPLASLPRGMRWVRILHLIRYARVDHNAAILAADRRDSLDELTRQVRSSPAACKVYKHTVCFWIPIGIAVVPESERIIAGKKRWVPTL
ncbi:MAG: hypothetical protein ACRD1J_06075 [Terriglobia bacterium]